MSHRARHDRRPAGVPGSSSPACWSLRQAATDAADHGIELVVDRGWRSPAWLSEHAARYGLCPIYGNQPWHDELRPDAITYGCPAMYPDPAHDPRMQQ